MTKFRCSSNGKWRNFQCHWSSLSGRGMSFPYHVCMVYLPTFTIKSTWCREIYYTWMVCLLFWTSFPGDSAAMTQLDPPVGGHFNISLRGSRKFIIPNCAHVFAELSGWWSLITWSQLIIDPRLWIGMLCHTRQLTTDLVSRFFAQTKITHHFTAGTQNIACGNKRIVLADFQKYFKVKALVDAIRPTESDKSVLRMSTTFQNQWVRERFGS